MYFLEYCLASCMYRCLDAVSQKDHFFKNANGFSWKGTKYCVMVHTSLEYNTILVPCALLEMIAL